VAGLQDAILVLLCLSVGLVLGGIVVSWVGWRRVGLAMHAASFLTVAALGITVGALAVRWERALPAAPGPAWIILYVFAGCAALAAAGALALRAGRACAAT
jgi:hypothetical protein